MSQRDELKAIVEFITEQLEAKWAILITHDRAGNVVAIHQSCRESLRFVWSLESKLFEGIEYFDITNEVDS